MSRDSQESEPDASPAVDSKARLRAGSAALKEMTRPVAAMLTLGRAMALISGVLAVVPYIAFVRIGAELLGAAAVDRAVDGAAVQTWLQILISTFAARLGIYLAALTVTHVADLKFGRIIRLRMVQRISQVPLAWFSSTNSGRVRKSVQDDIGVVHQLIAHRPVEVVNAVIMPLALMIYAFLIDWRLGLLSIATLPVYALAMAFSLRGMGEMTVQMDRKLSVVSARTVEFVTGIAVVKAFGRVGRAHRSYQEAADDFHTFYAEWVKPLVRVAALGNSCLAVPLILLVNIGGGALLVHSGAVTAADVLTTSLIALLVPYALETLMSSTWSTQLAGAAALRLQDILHTPTLPRLDDPGDRPQGHDVVFDRVEYSYAGSGRLAVDDLSFTLREGTITALIGPSGSGKSTIATLLARFDDPQSGSVSIGGVPVQRIADLYAHVGFVLQDPQLLGISIRDNIRLGRPDASDEQVRAAARAARVLHEIESLPAGFDTIHGDGSGLSGGQAQRIAIARALLVDAPVLVLDEATALADPEAQAEIQQALSELVRGRTVLVIGHRRETISGVDQILVIDAGRLVAAGTHDELLANPQYARLWRSGAPASTRIEGDL
ncbi:ABC transporter ATP-binding protein [Tsukamurella serpentis]